MKTLNLSEAKNLLSNLVDSVEPAILTRNGKAVGVVLNMDAYESMCELLAVTRDPERFAAIMAAHRQVQGGDYSDFVSLDEVDERMNRRAKERELGAQG